MTPEELSSLLEDVRSGRVSPDDARASLARLPFSDLGYARVDHHRELRQGLPEAVYGPGKTPEQCAGIVAELLTASSGPVLLTRASEAQAKAALEASPDGRMTMTGLNPDAHYLVSWRAASPRAARVLVVTAGTADSFIGEECSATLRAYGFVPTALNDCGVAGIHRLLAHYDELVEADAIVVIAGMEGALASVVGGITSAPVIAVPSSAGYGAGLEGVTALLAMHAACAAGITVVGIDNGFGAASAVARILR